jgi:hypothetical protein
MNSFFPHRSFSRFSAVLMSCLILFTQTELNQLLKLPVFIRHFSEHQQKDPGISVIKFIAMHYYGNDMDDSDNATDEQLPFKSHTGPAAFCCILQHASSGIRVYELNDTAVNVSYSFYTPQRISFDIWQPPKI